MTDGEQVAGQEAVRSPIAFFIMPGNALKSLRDELEISSGENMTEGILYRYGFRCGEGMVQDMNETTDDMISLSEKLPGLWAGAGLGRIKLKEVGEKKISLIFTESVEAASIGKATRPTCDFTRGYLAGMATALLNRNFVATEDECIAKGDKYCVHNLVAGAEDLKPTQEGEVKTESKYRLERGTSYLVEEESADLSYDLFTDCATHGAQGLCITRDYPEKIRKKYNLQKTPILWLSNSESEFAIEPVQLGKLYHRIEDFLKKSQNSIVLLGGIEYIITQNNYTSALKFLQLVRDQISIHDSLLISPISPTTLAERDLKLIEREMTVLDKNKVTRK